MHILASGFTYEEVKVTEAINKAKGHIKQAVGEVVGNEKLVRAGKVDVLKGEVEGAVEDVRRAVRGAVKDTKGAVARAKEQSK